MTYSDMIHAYFDEGVDASFEDLLFEQLASDPDLRREFTGHMRLHAMVTADALALHAPLQVTTKVFGNLGLPAPAGAERQQSQALPPAAVNTRARLVPLLRSRAATSFVTACVLIAAIALLRPFAGDTMPAALPQTPAAASPIAASPASASPTAASPAAASPAAASPIAASPIAASPASASPTVQARPIAAMEHPASPGHVSAAMTIPDIPAASMSGTIPAEATASDAGVTEPAVAEAAILVAEREAPVTTIAPSTPMPSVASADNAAAAMNTDGTSPGFLSHLLFEMRVLNSQSNPRIDLPISSYSMFKDLAFSVLYRIDGQHALGLEYGREAFGQAFYSTERIEEPLVDLVTKSDFEHATPWTPALYHRNAMLDWYGATWQFSLPRASLFSTIYPYSRVFLGATKQGPLGKARLGIQIAPTDISMFNIGFEGALLRYRYEGVWYTTTKLGFTCGLAIGL